MKKKTIILLLALSVLSLILGLAGCLNTPPDDNTGSGNDKPYEFPFVIGTKGLEYEYDAETDSYSCTGLGAALDTYITIFPRFNGKPVTSIGDNAFLGCDSLISVKFENTAGWKVANNSDMTNSIDVSVTDPEQNAKYLTDGYCSYYWKRDNA